MKRIVVLLLLIEMVLSVEAQNESLNRLMTRPLDLELNRTKRSTAMDVLEANGLWLMESTDNSIQYYGISNDYVTCGIYCLFRRDIMVSFTLGGVYSDLDLLKRTFSNEYGHYILLDATKVDNYETSQISEMKNVELRVNSSGAGYAILSYDETLKTFVVVISSLYLYD